ncbi:MAG: hypothetical protein K8R59_07880, partial [Thermoanaerobaculales bacterium]|nr:hypothetical protein [Thermoanaerobaculales bacterium]
RRFLGGKPLSAIALKIIESVALHTKIAGINQTFSADDVESILWQTLMITKGSRERTARKRRLGDRFALCFHLRRQEPVIISIEQSGDREILHIRTESEDNHSRKRIHISLDRVIAIDRRMNLLSTAHDLLTLYWNPMSFRISWLPSLLRNLGSLAFTAAGLGIFHLKSSLTGRR